jgi:hypothetical protein
MSPNAGEGGGVAGSQPMSTAVHMEPKQTLDSVLTYGPGSRPSATQRESKRPTGRSSLPFPSQGWLIVVDTD